MDYSCNSSKDKSSNQVEANAKNVEGESFHNLNTSPYSLTNKKRELVRQRRSQNQSQAFKSYWQRFLSNQKSERNVARTKAYTNFRTHRVYNKYLRKSKVNNVKDLKLFHF